MHQFLCRNTLKVVSPSGLSDRQTRVSGIVNCECETHWFPFTTISVKTSRFLCTEIIHSNVQKVRFTRALAYKFPLYYFTLC